MVVGVTQRLFRPTQYGDPFFFSSFQVEGQQLPPLLKVSGSSALSHAIEEMLRFSGTCIIGYVNFWENYSRPAEQVCKQT
jgi:hypothetical protein